MASRLVLVLGDLFIPDRAAVRSSTLIDTTRPHKLTGFIGYPSEGMKRPTSEQQQRSDPAASPEQRAYVLSSSRSFSRLARLDKSFAWGISQIVKHTNSYAA